MTTKKGEMAMEYAPGGGGYENPPAVMEPSAFDTHTMANEEFDDVRNPKGSQKPRDQLTVKEAIMLSRPQKQDGSINFNAKSAFEIIMYFFYLAVLVYAAFWNHSVKTFYYTNVMGALFTSTPDSTGKTFSSACVIDDIFNYMKDVFVPGLYNQRLNDENGTMVYYQNKLLGMPRIRMVQVTNTSCTVVKSFSREIQACYGPYTPEVEDKTPLQNGDQSNDGSMEPFTWQSADALENSDSAGTVSTYGGGGYVQNLPLDDQAGALALILNLKNQRWINRGARAVMIDFALYNANEDLFCMAEIMFELPATGGVIPSSRFNSYDLLRYKGTAGKVLIGLEGAFVGFIAFFLFEEFFELLRVRLKYFTGFWNLMDIFIIGLSISVVILGYNRATVGANRINQVLQNGLQKAAFDDVVCAEDSYKNVVSLILFLSWIKVFKYIGVNKTMSQLSSTLTRSAKDIGGFAVMFAVFFFAYAQFGYLVFGTQIQDYSTFYDAVFALLRTILGDFDFNALETANGVLGPVFFVSYVFFVFFVLLNMFLAIINDSYVEVKAELARQKDGVSAFDWIRHKFNQLTKRSGKKADAHDERAITFDDYKDELKKAGYTEEAIEAAYVKYDISAGDTVNDKLMGDVGAEVQALDERKNIISGEFRQFNVIERRVNHIEKSIVDIVGKMDKVLQKLRHVENVKVRGKEYMNHVQAELMLTSGSK